jgi:uncharacterized membrane protein
VSSTYRGPRSEGGQTVFGVFGGHLAVMTRSCPSLGMSVVTKIFLTCTSEKIDFSQKTRFWVFFESVPRSIARHLRHF